MNKIAGAPREIAVPVGIFDTLRSEIEREVGKLDSVRALHHAGYYAGLAAAPVVHRESGGDAFALSSDGFWSTLSDFFSKRGWGTVRHSAPHGGIGLLSSSDWAEANSEVPRADASCSFSAGYLSGLLSQLAGGAIAVLEVGCRSRGGDQCAFAFGSEEAIHDLYGLLLDGADLEEALAAL